MTKVGEARGLALRAMQRQITAVAADVKLTHRRCGRKLGRVKQ